MHNDIFSENKNDKKIKGLVCIEYRDPLTNKIKEKIESENLAFNDSFDGTAWFPWLNLENGSTPTFFVTDGKDQADPNFPYLPGKVLGWGAPGLNMSGEHQAQHVASESFKARVSEKGRKTSWKFVYDFYPTQIPVPIKCFGLTAQFQSLHSYNAPLYPTRRFIYNTVEQGHYITVGQKNYRFHNSSVATIDILDALTSSIERIDISSKIEAISGWVFCLGLNFLNNKPYVLAYHSTSGNRRIYEFEDLSFENMTKSWTPNNLVAYPSTSRVFWVDDDFNYYYWNSNVFKGNFEENINATAQTSFMEVCPWNNNGWGSGQIGSLVAKEGKLFIISEYYSTSKIQHPIIDLSNMTYYGSVTAVNRASSTTYGAVLAIDPTSKNKSILMSNYAGLYLVNKQAFTHFNVPENAPERPVNTIARINYQVDVIYPFEE